MAASIDCIVLLTMMTSQVILGMPQDAPNTPLFEQLPPVSPDDVIRPLENMADRFLRSQTMGVFDSFTARALESLAKFVDDAGLAVVSIVDRLPQTIDRVADNVDDVVKNADNFGREVAAMVTAPARIVLTGMNPNTRLGPARRPAKIQEAPHRQELELLQLEASNSPELVLVPGQPLPESLYENEDSNSIQGSSDANEEENRRQWSGDSTNPESLDLERGTRSSSPTADQSEGSNQEGSQTPPKEKRRRRPPMFGLLGSLGLNFGRRRNNPQPTQNNEDGQQTQRPKNVFERNFERSQTQQSIRRLEEEFGGFLGRLLGTVYRNADNIDVSLSKGLRRVLGNNRGQGANNAVRISGQKPNARPSSDPPTQTPTTTTTTEFPFRLSFDDVEPAPVKNSATLLP